MARVTQNAPRRLSIVDRIAAPPKHLPPANGTSSTVVSVLDKAEALALMNDRYFVTTIAGQPVVCSEHFDPILGRSKLVYVPFAAIRDLHVNQQVKTHYDKETRKWTYVPLGRWWLGNAQRREYDGIIFDPAEAISENYYNLWKGFAVRPKRGDWSLLRTHMLDVICGGDETLFSYLYAWLASMVQQPGQQAETAVVLRGPQGSGKGILGRALNHLFGPHAVHLSNSRHLTGHFNAHLHNAVFVFGDEAFGTDDKAAIGTLKRLITEHTIVVERKGRDAFEARNCTHILLSSNERWVVPTDLDDRRFYVLDVNASRVGDTAYFKAIIEQLEEGGYEAMLYDLLKHDIQVDLRIIPKTAASLNQKILSMKPPEKYWLELLTGDRPLPDEQEWKGEVLISKDALHRDYAEWIGREQDRGTTTELGMFLTEMLRGNLGETRPQANKRRQRQWILPPLKTCRKIFVEQIIRQPYTWPK